MNCVALNAFQLQEHQSDVGKRTLSGHMRTVHLHLIFPLVALNFIAFYLKRMNVVAAVSVFERKVTFSIILGGAKLSQ